MSLLSNEKQYWLYYQVNLTGTWMPCNMRFYSKDQGKSYIKTIKKGDTIYRTDLKYKIDK